MKDRILEIMHYQGLSRGKFAEAIGIQSSALSHIENGRNKPSLDVAVKILQKYEYINPSWLIMGKGEMLLNSVPQAPPPSLSPPPLTSSPDLFSQIPNQAPQTAPSRTNPPQRPFNSPKGTTVVENRREIGVEKPQIVAKQPVEDAVSVKKSESKKVDKIMIYYSDNTYETFIPEKIRKD
ncbi:MAG: helix-turn-helix domain-containing protein [Clostridiales bacterium]|jgi:transcriptional regulator with XRE-family HTH domain|nr:helix-turn-helix domain-containing protein [Clostridiales bacterium]